MKKVLLLMAEGFEEIEAITVIDLCRRAGFGVTVCGLSDTAAPVRGRSGVVIETEAGFAEVDGGDYDMLVLPGGQPGSDNLRADQRVIELVRARHAAGQWLAAICAAPMVLAAAGALAGETATGYPGCLESMNLSGVELKGDPVVVSGRVITSKGPGTAMDFALRIIEELAGRPAREKVESGLQRC